MATNPYMRPWERVAQALLQHPGGLSRKMLAHYAQIEEETVSAQIARVRDDSNLYGDALITLKRGGEWIYAWATLEADWREHERSRLRYRRTSALRSEKVAEQAYAKFKSVETYSAMISARHERENADVMLARLK